MKLMPVVNLLKAGAPKLTSVQQASSLVALDDNSVQPPVAFVHPLEEAADANELLGRHTSQDTVERFVVMVAARNLNVKTEVEELEDVRDEIRAALLAQQPWGDQRAPIELVTGKIIDVTSQIIWWRDTFQTRVLYRG